MSGLNYIADTNCFIYLLDEHMAILPFIEGTWTYSYITEIELLSKKNISTKEDKLIRQMLNACFRASHNQEISETVIKLRRKYGIKIPDAIIAATAITMSLPLLTADSDFSQIKELDLCLLEL